MLAAIGTAALASVARFKSGGLIVNEHTLTREETRVHVDALGRWFDFIHLDDLVARIEKPGKRPFCLLTFDDGKRSNVTVTAPELERLGVPACFFVVTGFLGGDKALWFDHYKVLKNRLGTLPEGLRLRVVKQLPCALLTERIERACKQHGIEADLSDDNVAPMSWDQARDLHKRGFRIGAHGVTHAIMTRETKEHAFENIEASIAQVTAEIGAPCATFAFPNGNYTAELAKHALRCGVRTVMTTEPTWTDGRFPLWRLPRLQLFGSQDRGTLELKIAVSAAGRILENPDGTGRAYLEINRISREAAKSYRRAEPECAQGKRS